jgi:diaminopropionate ammonia-lyase
MTTYATQLFLNPQAQEVKEYGPAQQDLLNQEAFADVKAEITHWPDYAPTPLMALNNLAHTAGVGALWCKHEGFRFGIGSFKPTGPTYAMLAVLKNEVQKAAGVDVVTTQDLVERKYETITRDIVVSATTSGNHGRALAWGARTFGCRCIVYMNDGVSAGRERAIAAYGAEVIRVPGAYDQAVQRSYRDAEALGYFVISDHVSAAYPHVPRAIMQGYAFVADEMVEQLADQEPPTHVFAPGGGGRLSAAVCGQLWQRYGKHRPRVIVTEPTASCCLYESAKAGRPTTVSGETKSVMDGLVVEEASAEAWTILGTGAFAFLTVPDQAAVDAMQQAAQPTGNDPPAVIGDTGSAGWAGFLAASSDPQLSQQLGLDDRSRVVIVVTEGATDPQVYRDIVGKSPDEVLAGKSNTL